MWQFKYCHWKKTKIVINITFRQNTTFRTIGRKWGFTATTCEELRIFSHLHFIWQIVWSSTVSLTLSICFCRHYSTPVFQWMKRQMLKISKIPVLAVLKSVNLKENVCCLQYSVLNSTFNMFKCRSTIRGFIKKLHPALTSPMLAALDGLSLAAAPLSSLNSSCLWGQTQILLNLKKKIWNKRAV